MHAQDGELGDDLREDDRKCYDSIRYALSDDGGELHFTSFQIVGGPECQGVEQELRGYLLSRPLRCLEPHRIKAVICPQGRQCIEMVARVVAEQQDLFAGEEEDEEEAGDAQNQTRPCGNDQGIQDAPGEQ